MSATIRGFVVAQTVPWTVRTVEAAQLQQEMPGIALLEALRLYFQNRSDSILQEKGAPAHQWPHLSTSLVDHATLRLYTNAQVQVYSKPYFAHVRQYIRCTAGFHGSPRADSVLVQVDANDSSFAGQDIGRVCAFIKVEYFGIQATLALVQWFDKQGRQPFADGCWRLTKRVSQGKWACSLIALEQIIRPVLVAPIADEGDFRTASPAPNETLADAWNGAFTLSKWTDLGIFAHVPCHVFR